MSINNESPLRRSVERMGRVGFISPRFWKSQRQPHLLPSYVCILFLDISSHAYTSRVCISLYFTRRYIILWCGLRVYNIKILSYICGLWAGADYAGYLIQSECKRPIRKRRASVSQREYYALAALRACERLRPLGAKSFASTLCRSPCSPTQPNAMYNILSSAVLYYYYYYYTIPLW